VMSLDLVSAFLQILSETSSRKGNGESYSIPAYYETVFQDHLPTVMFDCSFY